MNTLNNSCVENINVSGIYFFNKWKPSHVSNGKGRNQFELILNYIYFYIYNYLWKVRARHAMKIDIFFKKN